MQSSEPFLLTISQLALALAGFLGVVAAFGKKHLSAQDKAGIKLVLQHTGVAGLLPLLTIICSRFTDSSTRTWMISSLAVAAFLVWSLAYHANQIRQTPPRWTAWLTGLLVISGLLACVVAFQAFGNYASAYYSFALVWLLVVAAGQFFVFISNLDSDLIDQSRQSKCAGPLEQRSTSEVAHQNREAITMNHAHPYTSDALFHLVGFHAPQNHPANYKMLKHILTEGWISHPPHEKNWGTTQIVINWNADLLRGEFLVPSVTCFADIPLSCLGLHAHKYGQFGISLKRSVLTHYHARPVLYIPFVAPGVPSISGRDLVLHIQKTFAAFDFFVARDIKAKPDISIGMNFSTANEAIEATSRIFGKDFIAYIKAFDSTLPLDHPDNFYMEREWRKFGNMELGSDYIQDIVVHEDFVDKAKSELPEFRDRIRPCPTHKP